MPDTLLSRSTDAGLLATRWKRTSSFRQVPWKWRFDSRELWIEPCYQHLRTSSLRVCMICGHLAGAVPRALVHCPVPQFLYAGVPTSTNVDLKHVQFWQLILFGARAGA